MTTTAQQAAQQQQQGQQNTLSRKVNSLRTMLERGRSQLELAMAKHMDPDRMIRLALTAASRVPRLLDCTPESIGLSLLTASQLGIEPNGRDGHLVPYGRECQFIPDFKGLIKLAYRNPRVQSFQASAVRTGDVFEYEYGTHAFIRHKPAAGQRGELTHAYAICKLKDADPQFVVLPREDVLKRKNASQTGKKDSGPWKDWPDEMWAKTAVKVLSKFIPLGGEFERAVEHDNQTDGVIDVQFTRDEPPSDEPPKSPEDAVAEKVAAARKKKAAEKPETAADTPAAEATDAEPAAAEPEKPTASGPPGPDDTFLDRIANANDLDACKAIASDLALAAQKKQIGDKSLRALREQLKRRQAALEST